jgi:hypothetical protein
MCGGRESIDTIQILLSVMRRIGRARTVSTRFPGIKAAAAETITADARHSGRGPASPSGFKTMDPTEEALCFCHTFW